MPDEFLFKWLKMLIKNLSIGRVLHDHSAHWRLTNDSRKVVHVEQGKTRLRYVFVLKYSAIQTVLLDQTPQESSVQRFIKSTM